MLQVSLVKPDLQTLLMAAVKSVCLATILVPRTWEFRKHSLVFAWMWIGFPFCQYTQRCVAQWLWVQISRSRLADNRFIIFICVNVVWNDTVSANWAAENRSASVRCTPVWTVVVLTKPNMPIMVGQGPEASRKAQLDTKELIVLTGLQLKVNKKN